MSHVRPVRFALLTALAALLFSTPALAAEWSAVRSEAGITVEQQETPGRVLPVLRATTDIAAEPDAVLAWITDASTFTRWMHNCEEAQLLKQDGEVSFAYTRVGAPWPVSDRDAVVRSTRSEPGGGHRVVFQSTDELGLAEKSGIVRMPKIEGSWNLEPNGAGGTRVVYQVDSDPGGSLPGWLVAQVANDMPYQTLLKLRRLVESGAER